jgi:hypothetical protein
MSKICLKRSENDKKTDYFDIIKNCRVTKTRASVDLL